MAAKKTSELVPLCHPVAITFVGVEMEVWDREAGGEKGNAEKESVSWQGTGQGDAYPFRTPVSSERPNVEATQRGRGAEFGSVEITATVSCDGKTGVEMEALTAASVAALTIYDMCKAVDKGIRVEGLRVVRKEGGKSGLWIEGQKEEG